MCNANREVYPRLWNPSKPKHNIFMRMHHKGKVDGGGRMDEVDV